MASSQYNVFSQITSGAFYDVLFDYRDDVHFRLLWDRAWGLSFQVDTDQSVDDQHKSLIKEEQVDPVDEFFIILNSKRPAGNVLPFPVLKKIDFSAHFSALSWAACYLIGLSRVKNPPACKILIIEPTDLVGNPTAERLKAVFHTLFPCVIFLQQPTLEDILKAVASLRDRAREIITPVQGDILASLLRAGVTTDRQDHHAIGNVMSAYVLQNEAGEEPSEKDEDGIKIPQEQKFPLQYEVVTLCRAMANHQVKPWRTGNQPLRDERVTCPLVLIDDMAELWRPFLVQALPNAQISSIPQRKFMGFLQNLPKRLRKMKSGQRFAARKCVGGFDAEANTEDPNIEDFILFLDMRLFPDGKERLQFYSDLADLGLQLHREKRLGPWLTTKQELTDWASEMRNIKAGKEKYPEPLLARILSLLDPVLPIVIFSSTHASDLIGPLSPFGNIVTAFRKPTPQSLSELVISDLKLDFKFAMSRALKIVATRQMLRRINKIGEVTPASLCQYCDVFFDESGKIDDERMYISGIGVCGGSELGEFHQKLHYAYEAQLSPGVTRFHQEEPDCNNSAERPTNFIPKRAKGNPPDWTAHWSKISKLAEITEGVAKELGVSLFAFSLEFAPKEESISWLETGEFPQERQLLDIGYSSSMVELIETLVFDLLQAGNRPRGEEIRLSLDFATRDVFLDAKTLRTATNDDQKLIATLEKSWGVFAKIEKRIENGNEVIGLTTIPKSIADRTPLRLTEIALGRGAGRRGAKSNLKIPRSRACIMSNWNNRIETWKSDKSENDASAPLPLHYLADFLANAAKNKNAQAKDFLQNPTVQKWFNEGVWLSPNESDICWQGILSKWEHGERVRALEKLRGHGWDALDKAPAFVRNKIGTWSASSLISIELRELFG